MSYTPPHCKVLSDNPTMGLIKLALQGASGTGKTTSGLTFPNIKYVDIDNMAINHRHRKDIGWLPFWDIDWVKSWYSKTYNPKQLRSALMQWIVTEGRKLENDDTLFLDSWTTLQIRWDEAEDDSPERSKSGEVDSFAFWRNKEKYALRLLDELKDLHCHIVVSFHESTRQDGMGKTLGKVQPLMKGSAQQQLGKFFTDFFRCISKSKLDKDKNTVDTEYFWQTKGDNDVDLKTRMDKCPLLVEPNFSVFKKYYENKNESLAN